MPVGIMTSKAQKSDRAPPIGVSLPSFLHQSPRKCVCVCVWVHGWRAAGSRQHLELDVSAFGCSSNGQIVLLDLVRELSAALGAVFAFCADS